MTFSNVNVFRNTVVSLRASEPGATADKITRGGAFSPNTQEAISIMRSDIDNQWENSYIIKYQSLMQNRLNRLKQDLTNAYKAILDVSSVQQVRENGLTTSNSAITDVYGRLLNNAGDAFSRLKYYDDEAAFAADDAVNGSAGDGVPSYLMDSTLQQYGANSQGDRNGKVEMRKLYVTGPALQITNSMKVAFRTEEVPPEYKQIIPSIPIIGDLIPGDKAFTPGQKVAEYSADVKSGGFWTTLNYLYNFAPRELKYSYPTAYSTTTEETGTRQVGGKQAVLFNSNVVDARDIYDGGSNGDLEDDGIPSYNATSNKPPVGARIKWSSSNANEGYTTERSPIFPQRDNNGNYYGDTLSKIQSPIDDRSITRRESDNDSDFLLNGILSNGNNTVKGTWNYPPGSPNKQTEYGSEESTGGSSVSIDNRIKWEYNHDGRNSADFTQSGGITGGDVHVAKALFLNHYTVQTQTVELNSSADSYGGVKALDYNSVNGGDQLTLRSTGIDGSAEHVFNDADKNKVQANTKDEKLMLSGSGKISKNFDGKFVSNLYTLQSFNGQNIATETANVNISSKNDTDKVVIAEYEGFKRAQAMNKGFSEDLFSEANNDPRSEADARTLANKIETEINATSMVDTDWHYSEYQNTDSVMFRYIDSVSYNPPGGGTASVPINFRPGITDGGAGTGDFNNVTVGFRKTFTLEPKDYQQAVYLPPTNADIYINTPSYVDRDVFVDAVTNGSSAGAELVVNGKLVTGGVNMGGGVIRYNLKGYLQGGDNVIGAQATFNQGIANDSFKLVPVTGSNAADINTWLNGRVSTVRAQNGDTAVSKLNQASLSDPLSSWQSKIMVRKAGDFTISDIITVASTDADGNGSLDRAQFNSVFPDPINPTAAQINSASPLMLDYLAQFRKKYNDELNSLGSVETVTKVKDNNTFATMLTQALNKKEYQDIFNMGLLNTNLGKTMVIKAQVSAPTGGSVSATMDIQYDPINNKFILVQSKFDAYGG